MKQRVFLEKPIIITGLSGAGISSVLKAMEDFKFEVFDNFPLALVPQLFADNKRVHEDVQKRVAIAVDTRTRGFSAECVLDLVQHIDAHLVFITCEDNILFQRFAETRRRHPLAMERSVSYGIKKERTLLDPLRQQADIVIDSTQTSIHDLRHMLEGYFAVEPSQNLTVSLQSFGFRNGIPRAADIVMDVRFLKNPHWEPTLKPKTGLDDAVGAYIREDEDYEGFLQNLKNLIAPLLPRYAAEGKSYLTIAIGCTGGKHRSVYTVEQLRAWLEADGVAVAVEHRDIPMT